MGQRYPPNQKYDFSSFYNKNYGVNKFMQAFVVFLGTSNSFKQKIILNKF